MLKLETSKMTKAIERAKPIRPRVRVISADDRTYLVWRKERHVESGYTVRFAVANGLKLGECNCEAGRRGQMCYHLASASQANVMVQSMRRQGASAPPPAPAPTITHSQVSQIGRLGHRQSV